MKNQNYKIEGRTNGWIAQRDIAFKGNCKITICEKLDLKAAIAMLENMFYSDYDDCDNIKDDNRFCYRSDGTASYEYDSRYFSIEKED